jgi:2Fe-2S ferredoxin
MPLLTIENLPGLSIKATVGTTLLASIQSVGHDWRHACGAKGRCTTCRIEVLAGAENLTPLTGPELRYQAAGRLLATERLTCQARLLEGDVRGRVPEATKLPYVQYVS